MISAASPSSEKGSNKKAREVYPIKQVLPTIKNKFVGATSGRPRAFNERPYNKRTENMKILCPFFTRLAMHGIACYTLYVYCRAAT